VYIALHLQTTVTQDSGRRSHERSHNPQESSSAIKTYLYLSAKVDRKIHGYETSVRSNTSNKKEK